VDAPIPPQIHAWDRLRKASLAVSWCKSALLRHPRVLLSALLETSSMQEKRSQAGCCSLKDYARAGAQCVILSHSDSELLPAESGDLPAQELSQHLSCNPGGGCFKRPWLIATNNQNIFGLFPL